MKVYTPTRALSVSDVYMAVESMFLFAVVRRSRFLLSGERGNPVVAVVAVSAVYESLHSYARGRDLR